MKVPSIATKDNLLEYALGLKIDDNDLPLVAHSNKTGLNKEIVELRKVTKIVFDKNEDNIEKLTTVFSTINSQDADLVYIFHNNAKKGELNFYMGVIQIDRKKLSQANETLKYVFHSNFSGCEVSEPLRAIKNEYSDMDVLTSIFDDKNLSVSMTTAIPSFKNKEEKKEKFTQGLEKFLIAMQDKEYTAVFLAKNISNMIETRKEGYEELYTTLFPLVSKDLVYGSNVGSSVGTSESKSYTETLNSSITKTISMGENRSEGSQKLSRMQKAQSFGVPFVGALIAPIIRMTDNGENNWFDSKTISETENTNRSAGTQESKGTSEGTTDTKSVNFSEGSSFQQTIKFENKFFKNHLDAIDMQLERIKHSQNYGMYDFAAYFFSDDIAICNAGANIYNSLIQGEESYLGHSYVKSFNKKQDAKIVRESIANFEHPRFKIDQETVTLSSMVNSKELAIAMSLPKKSVPGLRVKESVEFGREIKATEKKESILIGHSYHLGKIEKHPIRFPLKNFTMHTLVTGATGSGKSTTTYKLIEELENKDIKFLVIEPTKGEYKHIFGNKNNVSVYGTNDKFSPLLTINPFSFPYEEIHILEHIDRLVEIFNACWPMYAAMPAVLKDAILNSYEKNGWDLDDSTNEDIEYPTFNDVLDSLHDIMDSSSYSDNTKSDYKGALSTRIESLTKGLVSKIFSEDELSDEKLFDENVVVDISRVGSSETKSLIMGILLLKLNQYRMAKSSMNSDLKHVTVLEEAHHLLPRTSTESSSESGNIKGKAVEMLSNAIAEMRTYGEGFIIVDQSPNMLDISAIRNTNTKIIMRLSELEDRNDIGKAATLTDEQIDEIPKLEQGVAVVYQNGWEESILCKVEKSKVEIRSKKYEYTKPQNNYNQKEILSNIVKLVALKGTKILREEQEQLMLDFCEYEDEYSVWAKNSKSKKDALNYIDNNEVSIKRSSTILKKLLKSRDILQISYSKEDDEVKRLKIQAIIDKQIDGNTKELQMMSVAILDTLNPQFMDKGIENIETKINEGIV